MKKFIEDNADNPLVQLAVLFIFFIGCLSLLFIDLFIQYVFQPLKKSSMSNTHRYILAYVLLAASFITFVFFIFSEKDRPFDTYSILIYVFSLFTFLASMLQFLAIENLEKTNKNETPTSN